MVVGRHFVVVRSEEHDVGGKAQVTQVDHFLEAETNDVRVTKRSEKVVQKRTGRCCPTSFEMSGPSCADVVREEGKPE